MIHSGLLCVGMDEMQQTPPYRPLPDLTPKALLFSPSTGCGNDRESNRVMGVALRRLTTTHTDCSGASRVMGGHAHNSCRARRVASVVASSWPASPAMRPNGLGSHPHTLRLNGPNTLHTCATSDLGCTSDLPAAMKANMQPGRGAPSGLGATLTQM